MVSFFDIRSRPSAIRNDSERYQSVPVTCLLKEGRSKVARCFECGLEADFGIPGRGSKIQIKLSSTSLNFCKWILAIDQYCGSHD